MEFSEPVPASFSIEDFMLQNLTTSATIDNFSLTTTFEAAKDNFVVTFDAFDGRVLPDGNDRLTIAAGNIRYAANNPMASILVNNLFVLAGDFNRDRLIGFDDLVALAKKYGDSLAALNVTPLTATDVEKKGDGKSRRPALAGEFPRL